MLVKIEARILIFPGTDFHFPSTSVPPGTFLGSVAYTISTVFTYRRPRAFQVRTYLHATYEFALVV